MTSLSAENVGNDVGGVGKKKVVLLGYVGQISSVTQGMLSVEIFWYLLFETLPDFATCLIAEIMILFFCSVFRTSYGNVESRFVSADGPFSQSFPPCIKIA